MANHRVPILDNQKQCTKCKQTKDLSQFRTKDHIKQYYDSWCYHCYTVNARKRREAGLAPRRTSSYYSRQRADRQAKIIAYLKEHPCTDCGEADPVVLEFDHLDPKLKRFAVTYMLQHAYSWHSIMLEIEKCEVVCANCHKRRTAKRQNWARLKHI